MTQYVKRIAYRRRSGKAALLLHARHLRGAAALNEDFLQAQSPVSVATSRKASGALVIRHVFDDESAGTLDGFLALGVCERSDTSYVGNISFPTLTHG
jgi:hypothetical protein